MSDLSDAEEEALAELLGAVIDRKNNGEEIDVEELKSLHPRFAGEIDSVFGMGDIFSDALGDAVLDRAFGDEEAHLAEVFPLAERQADLPFGSVHLLGADTGSLARELIAIDPLFPAASRRHLSESVRFAATYQVPGFLRVLDHGRLDQGHYLVREKLTGPTLGELLDRILESGRLLPAAEAEGAGRPVDAKDFAVEALKSEPHRNRLLGLFRDWARILDTGHARGLVHRELNAENLAIDAQGKAVIQGLGLAWQGTDIKPKLLSGWLPHWLAPEVIDKNWGPVTHLADVYGLGRALADALSLARPCAPSDAEGELMRIAVGDRSFMDQLPKNLPEPLSDLIERATFPDPARRLSSLAEFANQLYALIHEDEEPRSWAARLFGR